MARPPRPCPAYCCRPDRVALIGVNRVETIRRRCRYRSSCALYREGSKGAVYAANPANEDDGVRYILAKHVATAAKACPSLLKKKVTPHVLRHTTAMEMLQAGIDRAVIALWLGHESVETTQIYLDANLALKEEVLAKTKPLTVANEVASNLMIRYWLF